MNDTVKSAQGNAPARADNKALPPTQKTYNEVMALIEGATLATIKGAAEAAGASVTRMGDSIKSIQGSLTTKTLRVIAKEPVGTVAAPLAAVLDASRTSNLASIRMAATWMYLAYGEEHTLPSWNSVKEATLSGKAAEGAFVLTASEAADTVAAEVALRGAFKLFGIKDAETEKKILKLRADVQAARESAEEGEEGAVVDGTGERTRVDVDGNDPEAAQAAQAAAEELLILRAMVERARVVLGVAGEATNREALAFFEACEELPALTLAETLAFIAPEGVTVQAAEVAPELVAELATA